jgi:phage terminase large subunit-like protein
MITNLNDISEPEMRQLARENPLLYAQVKYRLDLSGDEREREKYEASLIAFFRRAWREIDPAPYEHNWHFDVAAEQLEALAAGRIRDLIVNLPPRMGKSNLISVIWPAWIWCQPPERKAPLMGPHVSFLCVSYGHDLAEVLATKSRRLIMGEWYQRLWGKRVQIRDDQASRNDFGNTAGGERISNSIIGGILGRGGAVQIIDDPHKLDEVESELERERTIRSIREGLSTRVTDPRISARVLTMQRVHQGDATNYALENWRRDLTHICLPMRFESDRACFCDLRQVDGQLLWPAMWSRDRVAQLEVELGDYGFAGQLQQRPTPRGGGIIGQDDWKIWPEWVPNPDDLTILPDGRMYVPLPEVSHVILSLDTNLSEKTSADWTACTIWGVWHRPRNLVTQIGRIDGAPRGEEVLDDGQQPRAIMMGAWRMRGKLNDEALDIRGQAKGVVQRVIQTARQFRADELIIEDSTRGLDVQNEIIRQLGDLPWRIVLFNPRKHGDKTARLVAVQPLFGQGLIYLPANCQLDHDQTTGTPFVAIHEFAWARMVMAEVESVPRGQHDDYADTVAQALLHLREGGYLALTREYIAEQVAIRRLRRPRMTVRDHYGV